jgi:hypothetical protein
MITFISSTRLFNSAKATKTRSGCWRTAVAEFYVGIITALFFALARICTARTRSAVTISFANFRIRGLRSFSCISASRRVGRSTSIRSFCRTISKLWCCNLEARVLRCQRKRRGFDSPQHRHGIGRSVAGPWLVRPMTRVRFPSHPPNLGVAQQ